MQLMYVVKSHCTVYTKSAILCSIPFFAVPQTFLEVFRNLTHDNTPSKRFLLSLIGDSRHSFILETGKFLSIIFAGIQALQQHKMTDNKQKQSTNITIHYFITTDQATGRASGPLKVHLQQFQKVHFWRTSKTGATLYNMTVTIKNKD